MSHRRASGKWDRRGGARTIVVAGMVAGVPNQGGATWAILQYLLGLRQLGHDVYLIEPVEPENLRGAGPRAAGLPLEETPSASYFRRVVAGFGLEEKAGLLVAGTRRTVGLSYAEMRAVTERADLLLNVSGMLADEALLQPIHTRAYLDLDPGFVQLWHHTQGLNMRFDAHTHFVTIGLSIGSSACSVPLCGRDWITTPQPVVLDHWPVADTPSRDAFTTVANWRGYGSIEHDGVFYGQKAHSLRRIVDLPDRTTERFVLALSIHADETPDLQALAAHGWELVDPAVAASPAAYRRFIQESKAELGVAKSGYVAADCGWFSDRSIAYLASGRPVLAQETGFSRHVPTGEGLLSFSTVEDAAVGIEAIARDYATHARAARALAECTFDSDRVLPRLLERLEVAS